MKNINELDYDSTDGKSIQDSIRRIFQNDNYINWVDMINTDISHSGNILVPIGKVCTEFLHKMHDINIEKGVYGIIVDNLIWELNTTISSRKKILKRFVMLMSDVTYVGIYCNKIYSQQGRI